MYKTTENKMRLIMNLNIGISNDRLGILFEKLS